MFRKPSILFTFVLSLFLLIGSEALNAQTGSDAKPATVADTASSSQGQEKLTSELSSAISPSSPPGALIGTATAFDLYWVDVKAGTDSGSNISSTINWGGVLPTGASPTTCTLTLSSPPPGPVQVELDGASGASGPVTMDSQNLVINKTAFADWFPAGLSTTYFSTAIFWIDGQWFSLSKDMTTAGGYPVLQWSPAALTITYQ